MKKPAKKKSKPVKLAVGQVWVTRCNRRIRITERIKNELYPQCPWRGIGLDGGFYSFTARGFYVRDNDPSHLDLIRLVSPKPKPARKGKKCAR